MTNESPGSAPSAGHRTDVIFTLPRLPRTARLVGDPPGWREGLQARGVEVIDDARTPPDLLVTSSPDSVPWRSAAVVIDGTTAATRPARPSAYSMRRLLPLPRVGDPQLLLDLGHHRAAGYALSHTVMPPGRIRFLKRTAAGALARRRLFPSSRSIISAGATELMEPALLRGARESGIPPDCSWFLVVANGTVDKRSVFVLFKESEATPSYVLKFSRAPRLPVHAARDERGLKSAERAAGRVAAHAPRFLGRFEVEGLAASVETAAVGHTLGSLISRAPTSARRMRPVERVARWLIEMAVETSQPPDALRAERDRLEHEVLPAWRTRGAPADLVSSLPPIPAVFLHGDLWEENVIVDREGDFTLLDWELARLDGFPLWDLFRYALHVLSVIDNAADKRVEYMADLFTGRAASSPVAFRWMREMVRALDLPPDAVGSIITLYLLDAVALVHSERARLAAERIVVEGTDQLWLERAAETWLTHPQLGPGWKAWRA